jgi:hypothetical protein
MMRIRSEVTAWRREGERDTKTEGKERKHKVGRNRETIQNMSRLSSLGCVPADAALHQLSKIRVEKGWERSPVSDTIEATK